MVFVATFIGTPQMNLLHAQFEGIEDGHGRFRIDGQPIRLHVDPAVAKLANGQVTIGIRPSALVLTGRERRRDHGQGGTHRAYGRGDPGPCADLSGNDIRVVVPRDIRVKAGDSLICARTHARRMCSILPEKRCGHERWGILPGRRPRASSSAAASRFEWSIIALGIFALALIFQPFSLTMFGVGCALVVFAGLANNLLPLCQPGTTVRSIVLATV